MILICGIPSEAPIKLVTDAAQDQGVDFVMLNQRDANYSDIQLTIRNDQAFGKITIKGEQWPLEDFTGVYVRLMNYIDLPEFENDIKNNETSNLAQKSMLFHEALTDWLETTNCKIMNRLSSMSSNFSKPFQAQLIQEAGFPTPPTLITNSPEEAAKFLKQHKHVIYKSISSERSIVKKLGDVKLLQLKNIKYLPTQFQALIPGTDVRVHVAGKQIFATEINANTVDYRYPSEEGSPPTLTPTQIPQSIEKKCLRLSRTLDLPLCGIDLKRTPEGKYYCFEANPSPGYSYYQQNTGQNIAQDIVDYLK